MIEYIPEGSPPIDVDGKAYYLDFDTSGRAWLFQRGANDRAIPAFGPVDLNEARRPPPAHIRNITNDPYIEAILEAMKGNYIAKRRR